MMRVATSRRVGGGHRPTTTNRQSSNDTFENSSSDSSSCCDHSNLVATCPVCYDELLDDIEQGLVDCTNDSMLAKADKEQQPLPSSVRLQACQHVFCRPCLQDYCTFTISSSSRSRLPTIQCPMTSPHCETVLSHDEVRQALIPEQAAAYQVYVRLERLSRDASLAPCPLCDELAGAELQHDLLVLAGQGQDVSSASLTCSETDSEGLTCNNTSIEIVAASTEQEQQQQATIDPNRRICLNSDCPQTTFCAIHGSAHSLLTCAEYMASVVSSKDSSHQDNGLDPAAAVADYQAHVATQQILSIFTKPCPHCGASICKSSGCDHVVCPMCQQDFCFKCGTHEFLTGLGEKDSRPSVFRSCSQCRQSYVDHRYMSQFRRRLWWMFPILFIGALLYSFVTLLVFVGSCFFCCCFGCGSSLQSDDNDDNKDMTTDKTATTSRRGKKFAPWLGIQHSLCILLLPFIALFRDFGMACSCFPERLPGDEPDDFDIPTMSVVKNEELTRK